LTVSYFFCPHNPRVIKLQLVIRTGPGLKPPAGPVFGFFFLEGALG
jgi:hypothetical protein